MLLLNRITRCRDNGVPVNDQSRKFAVNLMKRAPRKDSDKVVPAALLLTLLHMPCLPLTTAILSFLVGALSPPRALQLRSPLPAALCHGEIHVSHPHMSRIAGCCREGGQAQGSRKGAGEAKGAPPPPILHPPSPIPLPHIAPLEEALPCRRVVGFLTLSPV